MTKTKKATQEQMIQASRRYGITAKTVSGYLSKGVMEVVDGKVIKKYRGRKPSPSKRPYAPVTTLCLEEYTITDLSEYLRVTKLTVRRWMRSNKVKMYKKVVDGSPTNYISKADLISLLDKNTV